MSDQRIRQLERLISEGDESAVLLLSKELQRMGQRAEYYAAQLVESFWEKFNITNFFDPTFYGNYLDKNFPDPFNLLIDGAFIVVTVKPASGIGIAPEINVWAQLYGSRAVADALAPGDPLISSIIQHDVELLDGERVTKYLNDVYTLWVEQGDLMWSNITVINREMKSISRMIYEAAVHSWSDMEEKCAALAATTPYIRPNPRHYRRNHRARRNPSQINFYRRNVKKRKKDKKKKRGPTKSRKPEIAIDRKDALPNAIAALSFSDEKLISRVYEELPKYLNYSSYMWCIRQLDRQAGILSTDLSFQKSKKWDAFFYSASSFSIIGMIIKEALRRTVVEEAEKIEIEEGRLLRKRARQAKIERQKKRQSDWIFILEAWQESSLALEMFISEWKNIFPELTKEELQDQIQKNNIVKTIPPLSITKKNFEEQQLSQLIEEDEKLIRELERIQEEEQWQDPLSSRTLIVSQELPNSLIQQIISSGGTQYETDILGTTWIFPDAEIADYFEEAITETDVDNEVHHVGRNKILIAGGMMRNIPYWIIENFEFQLIPQGSGHVTEVDFEIEPDLVICFEKHSSHALSESVIAVARKYKIPYITTTKGYTHLITVAKRLGLDWFVDAAMPQNKSQRLRNPNDGKQPHIESLRRFNLKRLQRSNPLRTRRNHLRRT